MSPLVRKEIRLLLPAWSVALLLAAVPPWFIGYEQGVVHTSWIAGIGAVILAVTAFGREFTLGTFSSVLAQPVQRGRIFTVKSVVLLVALACVLATFWFSYVARVEWIIGHPDWPWYYGTSELQWKLRKELARQDYGLVLGSALVGGSAILAGGLWTTLIIRQMVAAFWITVLAPVFLLGSTGWLGAQLHVGSVQPLVYAVLILYSLAGVAWSWRLFQRTEDTPFSWGGQTLPSFSELVGMKRDRRGHGPGHPVVTLIRQELSLQQASLISAGVLLLLNLGCIGIRASGLLAPESDVHDILEPIGIFWCLIPLMLGASAISEERRLGTLESHLCLPISRRKQFLIKSGLAAGLGVLLGTGALLATELLGREFGVSGILEGKVIDTEALFWLPVTCVGLTLAGLYASSLSRSTLQALGLGLVLWVSALFVFLWATDHFRFYRDGENRWSPESWILWVNVGAFLCVLAVLAYRNFGQIQCGVRWVIQNVMVIALTLTLVATLSAGIYHRAWEFVMALEPEHGPAQIVGSGAAEMAGMWAGGKGGKLLVLLPDGRLWSSGDREFLYSGERYTIPAPGAFLGSSNWTDIAACHIQAIALRSDGTLWSLARSELIGQRWKLVEDSPRQIGVESNWVTVAAGRSHLLALKGDGTLWGWGGNGYSQVREGPELLTNGPARIGLDSDWAQVFARNHSSVGVKRDGTSWQWGSVYTVGKDGLGFKSETCTQPVRWNANLRWVRKLVGSEGFDLLLHEDGTLWALGYLPYDVLGTPTRRHYAHEPVRVGGDRLWLDIGSTWNEVLGVSKDGRLWKGAGRYHKRKVMTLSNHDDWIAVEGVFGPCNVALAEDGTLSFWDAFYRQEPLAPSRRPLTSFNIFDERE